MSIDFLSAIKPPRMTEAQRNALLAGHRGEACLVYNTDSHQVEMNVGTDAAPVWVGVGPRAFTGVILYISANQDLPTNGADHPIVFDQELFDKYGYHDAVVNPSRATVPVKLGGIYQVSASVPYNVQQTQSNPQTVLRRSGVEDLSSQAGGRVPRNQDVEWWGVLNEGDYIEVVASLNNPSESVHSIAGGTHGVQVRLELKG